MIHQAWIKKRASETLVVYDGTDLASMVGDEHLSNWHRDTWLVRLPRPPRDERPLSDEEARRHGLTLAAADDYSLEWGFSLDGYIAFLMTQSNVTDFVERQSISAATLQQWLRAQLAPLFDGEQQRLRFGGYIWYLRGCVRHQRHLPSLT